MFHDAIIRPALEKFKKGHRLVVEVDFLSVHLAEFDLPRHAVEVLDDLLLVGVVGCNAIGDNRKSWLFHICVT